MTKNKRPPPYYFKFVNPIIVILHTAVVGLLVVTYLDPKYITPERFGPISQYATLVGTEYKYYLKLGLLSFVALHLLEAMIAVYKCQKWRLRTTITIAWTLQTLYMGIFSLRYLIWPQKPAPPPAPKPAKPTKPTKASKAKSKKQK